MNEHTCRYLQNHNSEKLFINLIERQIKSLKEDRNYVLGIQGISDKITRSRPVKAVETKPKQCDESTMTEIMKAVETKLKQCDESTMTKSLKAVKPKSKQCDGSKTPKSLKKQSEVSSKITNLKGVETKQMSDEPLMTRIVKPVETKLKQWNGPTMIKTPKLVDKKLKQCLILTRTSSMNAVDPTPKECYELTRSTSMNAVVVAKESTNNVFDLEPEAGSACVLVGYESPDDIDADASFININQYFLDTFADLRDQVWEDAYQERGRIPKIREITEDEDRSVATRDRNKSLKLDVLEGKLDRRKKFRDRSKRKIKNCLDDLKAELQVIIDNLVKNNSGRVPAAKLGLILSDLSRLEYLIEEGESAAENLGSTRKELRTVNDIQVLTRALDSTRLMYRAAYDQLAEEKSKRQSGLQLKDNDDEDDHALSKYIRLTSQKLELVLNNFSHRLKDAYTRGDCGVVAMMNVLIFILYMTLLGLVILMGLIDDNNLSVSLQEILWNAMEITHYTQPPL